MGLHDCRASTFLLSHLPSTTHTVTPQSLSHLPSTTSQSPSTVTPVTETSPQHDPTLSLSHLPNTTSSFTLTYLYILITAQCPLLSSNLTKMGITSPCSETSHCSLQSEEYVMNHSSRQYGLLRSDSDSRSPDLSHSSWFLRFSEPTILTASTDMAGTNDHHASVHHLWKCH